ncbi:MAG: cytochrome b/b6 domain-containing protein [Planctomycetes bacterium]|nr:cytochrome b/b6 domain-containing protein [Planctomycetota bacterium]
MNAEVTSGRGAGRLALFAALSLLAASVVAQGDAEGEVTMEGCFNCHSDPDNTMEWGDGTEVSTGIDRILFLESAHGELDCMACHQGLDPMEHAFADHENFAEYRKGLNARCAECHAEGGPNPDAPPIHQLLHPANVDKAPLCSDCHAAHAARRTPAAHVSMSKACATCHESTYAELAGSAHGAGVLDDGDRDLPSCTTCHSGHDAVGKSSAARDLRLGMPCMGCHGDKDLMSRYDLSTDVVDTYLQDFHGTSLHFYKADGTAESSDVLRTLVCADCHGVHDVAKVREGGAAALKANLRQVCAKCHDDASTTFPDAWMSHYRPTLESAPIVFGVKTAYWIFIPFVIIGLSIQIFAHLVLLPRRRRRLARAGVAAEPHDGPHILPGDERRFVLRFGRWQRLEHLLGAVSFILLLLTGLPQKFWESDWATSLIATMGGIDMVRNTHRIVGLVFAALCVLHVGIAILKILSGRSQASMVPQKQDFRDALQNLQYYFGLRKRPPQFDRFDYKQKFEYWGMLVGSAVMIVSGFVLFFPTIFAAFLPGQLIPAAKMAHSYEAMMAFLTIVVWHLYGALFNPDCAPLDKSIFTGRISVARMKHEHALEWAREADRLEVVELQDAAEGASDRDAEATVAPGRLPG